MGALLLAAAACGGDSDAGPTTTAGPGADSPLLVMPIGDSITAGPFYRLPLARSVADAEDCHIDFIGTFDGAGGVDPAALEGLDDDHQAIGGATSAALVASLEEPLTQLTPDVAMVYMGTNDFYNDIDRSETIENLESVIEQLRAANPRVRVLLAQIMPSIGVEDGVAALNARIAELGDRLDSSVSAVEVLDFHTDVDVDADLLDGVHPTEERSAEMAAIWADALAPLAGEGCVL